MQMNSTDILNSIGQFSSLDQELFEKYTSRQVLQKKEVLLQEGEICRAFYFIISGSFTQYHTTDLDELIVDLHVQHEWMFNQESLTEQLPSKTSIRAFSNSEIIALRLENFHSLCSHSPAFLQFGKILNQPKVRLLLFDSGWSPIEKYKFILQNKPELLRTFPLKLLASYLKMTPETLSRARATVVS